MRTFGAHCWITEPEGLAHINTGSRDPHSLAGLQLAHKEFVERFFLPLRPEPQRLSSVQITHHRNELLLLAR
jgi:hypothetical protein